MRSLHLIVPTILWIASFAGCHHHSVTQQADLAFEPPIPLPAYPEGRGSVVQIDEAHTNFHTADGRYSPFAKLLRRDGYVVQGLAEPASSESLARGDIYVVANAIAESDEKGWKLPIESAFTDDEIEAVRTWVENGGSLLLIADHAVTEGRNETERVEFVRTFTGQAFRGGPSVEPLLTLPPGSELRLPSEAWEFKPTTPKIPAAGMLQGAVLDYGRGRVAVFGEAAMFTAQSYVGEEGPTLMGMNHPEATQNPQFLLNTIHWLSGLID